jgi:hypothetical protein
LNPVYDFRRGTGDRAVISKGPNNYLSTITIDLGRSMASSPAPVVTERGLAARFTGARLFDGADHRSEQRCPPCFSVTGWWGSSTGEPAAPVLDFVPQGR